MSQLIIGLTGGIGSGKTTVANLFSELGIILVDADVIAREIVAPGTPALNEIIQYFSADILSEDGSLNRRKLRDIIFNQKNKRNWLNNLLHPKIKAEMLKQASEAKSPYVILVVPLLFENGLDSLVNQTLMVDLSPSLQISRTLQRDKVDTLQIKNIINSQMSREDKLKKADDVIDNHGEISQLKTQVLQLHEKYLQLIKHN